MKYMLALPAMQRHPLILTCKHHNVPNFLPNAPAPPNFLLFDTLLEVGAGKLALPAMQMHPLTSRTLFLSCWTRTQPPGSLGRPCASTPFGKPPCPSAPCLLNQCWMPSSSAMACGLHCSLLLLPLRIASSKLESERLRYRVHLVYITHGNAV